MIDSKVFKDASIILDALGWKPSVKAINRREFSEADLDAISVHDLYPEDSMRLFFLEKAEKSLLDTIFHGDRAALDEFLVEYVTLKSQYFNDFIYKEWFEALGLENIHFFFYCISEIFGHPFNPYFGIFDEKNEEFSLWIFEYIRKVDCKIITKAIPATRQNLNKENAIGYNYEINSFRKELIYRGSSLNKDGTLNRNSLRNAMLKYKWIIASNENYSMSSPWVRLELFTKDQLQMIIDSQLQSYSQLCLMQYADAINPSESWFVKKLYYSIENLLAFSTDRPKIDRNTLRRNNLEGFMELSKSRNESLRDTAFWLMNMIIDIKKLGEFMGVGKNKMPLLYIFYFVATSWEYIMDIAPMDPRKMSAISKKAKPVINKWKKGKKGSKK